MLEKQLAWIVVHINVLPAGTPNRDSPVVGVDVDEESAVGARHVQAAGQPARLLDASVVLSQGGAFTE